MVKNISSFIYKLLLQYVFEFKLKSWKFKYYAFVCQERLEYINLEQMNDLKGVTSLILRTPMKMEMN